MLQELQRQHEAHKARRSRLMPKRVEIKQAGPVSQSIPVKTEPRVNPNDMDFKTYLQLSQGIGITREGGVVRDQKTSKPVRPHTAYLVTREYPSLDDIIDICCEFYGIKRIDMLSARRTKNLAMPRHIAFYLSKELTVYSLPHIGRKFSNRDHTTILSGCRKIARLQHQDRELMDELNHLSDHIMEVHRQRNAALAEKRRTVVLTDFLE